MVVPRPWKRIPLPLLQPLPRAGNKNSPYQHHRRKNLHDHRRIRAAGLVRHVDATPIRYPIPILKQNGPVLFVEHPKAMVRSVSVAITTGMWKYPRHGYNVNYAIVFYVWAY
jgi:hypothetical protein